MPLWIVQTVVVNVIVALSFLGYGAYTAWEQSSRVRDEIIRDAHNLALSIVASSANYLLTESYDQLEGNLLRQATLGQIRDLQVSDRNGLVISRVRKLDDDSVEPVYGQQTHNPVQSIEVFDAEDFYVLRVPIRRNELLGEVRVVASLRARRDIEAHIWEDTIGALLATILGIGLIQALLLRRMARDLELSADFADELVQQQGRSIAQNCRITEIRRLNTALNRVSLNLARQHRTLVDSERRKTAILEAWMDCLVIIDDHGRIIEFNKAAEETFGHPRHEVIGRDMAGLIIPERLRDAHHAGMRHYLSTGEGPVLGQRLEMPALRNGGEEFPTELTIVPFTAHGERFFLGAIRDVSEQKKLEAERKVVEDRLLSTLADLDARDRALDDHAIVSATDLQGAITYTNSKFRKISGYTDEELLGRNHRILKSGLHDEALYRDMWLTISEGRTWHGEIANRRKDGSIYWVMTTIVPVLGADDLPYQYISIRTDITEQKLSAEKLARARARELSIGFQIQQSLLFGEIPIRFGPVSLSVHVEPSEGIDGDFYEFAPIEGGCFDIAVGDVMGKGVPAALIGAGVKQALGRLTHARQISRVEPAELVNALGHMLYDRLLEFGSFVTFAYFRFDPDHRRLTFVDAGHTKAILAGAEGTRLLEGDNLPLGVMPDEEYRQSSIDWRPGDTLLLYSDGLTEELNAEGEMFGTARLAEIVKELNREGTPAVVINQAVRARVLDFLPEGAAPADDITCVVVDYPDHPHPLVALDLHWHADELARLRAEVGRTASAEGLAEQAVQELVLAVSETAANIVRHAPERLQTSKYHVAVAARADDVEVAFHYIGDDFTRSKDDPDFSGESDSGYGLFIVRNSVDEVSYDVLPHGVFRILLRKRRTPAGPPAQA